LFGKAAAPAALLLSARAAAAPDWQATPVAGLRSHLHRYWVRFETPSETFPLGASVGVGVTAMDRADAERVSQESVFQKRALPRIASVIEDVDIRDLDEGHVLPNVGDPSLRGIWFPYV
jgi:anti-sigma factor RsiW